MNKGWQRDLQLEIEPHLLRIGKLLGLAYKLTLIARCTNPDIEDADIVISGDDIPKAIAAAERLSKREPTARPEIVGKPNEQR